MIYHKFSHGAAFYTLNGKNVNVMLELKFAYPFVLRMSHKELLMFLISDTFEMTG